MACPCSRLGLGASPLRIRRGANANGLPFSRDWNEQNGSTKKDVESTNVGGGLRERRLVPSFGVLCYIRELSAFVLDRFRREAEDGGKLASKSWTVTVLKLPYNLDSTRPSFRSALSSQPSQMGNFKHQPLRPNNDRDRDTGDLRTVSVINRAV